jgi:hypothetical protein
MALLGAAARCCFPCFQVSEQRFQILLGTAGFYRSLFLPLYRQQPACFHGNGGRKIAVVTSDGCVGTAWFVAAGGGGRRRSIQQTFAGCKPCISAATLERRQLLTGGSFRALDRGYLALSQHLLPGESPQRTTRRLTTASSAVPLLARLSCSTAARITRLRYQECAPLAKRAFYFHSGIISALAAPLLLSSSQQRCLPFAFPLQSLYLQVRFILPSSGMTTQRFKKRRTLWVIP